MITDRIQKFFIEGVIWLLLKTMANQPPETRISRPTLEIGERLLMEDSQENEDPGFGSATNSEWNKSRHAFAWRLHCCSRDHRSRSAVGDCGCKNQLLVRDGLRCSLVHFDLRAHFLDLRGLLFQLSRENLHPFRLLRDGDF